MKKLLTLFTLLLLVASCSKEADISPNGDNSSGVVSFSASVVDMTSTKATLINSWSGGEEVALFVDGDDAVYHFTIAADGTMSGDDVIANQYTNNTYTAFYPYDETLTTFEAYAAACTAGEVDYMKATTTTYGTAVELQFSHQMAALSFTILIESTVTNPTISLALDGNFNSAATLEYETTTVSSNASILDANYFVADGTDPSSAMIKLEYSGEATFHSIAQEEAGTLEAGKHYPYSYICGDFPTGSGTESDPYIVNFAIDMRKVGTGRDGWALDSHYILAWDIDLGNIEFTAIGTSSSSFTGTFDGDGHEVSGLYINKSASNQGLFGCISGATIKNLTVSGSVTGTIFTGGIVGCSQDAAATIENCYNKVSVNGTNYVGGVAGYINYDGSIIENCGNAGKVVGSGDYVGGVVGRNNSSSTMSNCYNTGSVEGSSYVGGVVGYNYSSISVSNCYNTGSIEGSSNVGGVVGYNNSFSTMSNCYNTGSVKGSNSVGGVVGRNYSYSTVSDCYNTGSVEGSNYVGGVVGYNSSSTVSDCYYLTTAYSGNGLGYSGGTVENVSSKTASEMQDADFVDLLNGEDGTAWMSDYATPINDGYPILSWQTSNN